MTAVGDARKRQAVENTRRVRVVVEGDAVGWPGSSVLRVYVGASQVVTVDPSWHGVSVEDVCPERVWTDGDVVQVVTSGTVYVRTGDGGSGWSAMADDVVTDAVREGMYRVLRYQAGE